MKRLLIILTVLVLGVTGVSVAAKARKTSGVVYASATHQEGNLLYVAGDFKDKILGRGAIVYVVTAAPGPQSGSVLVKAKRVTIFTAKGSLRGTGQATQTTNPDGSTTVTNGTFSLTKGTRGFKGHRLSGTFEGPLVNGVYNFKYQATYR